MNAARTRWRASGAKAGLNMAATGSTWLMVPSGALEPAWLVHPGVGGHDEDAETCPTPRSERPTTSAASVAIDPSRRGRSRRRSPRGRRRCPPSRTAARSHRRIAPSAPARAHRVRSSGWCPRPLRPRRGSRTPSTSDGRGTVVLVTGAQETPLGDSSSTGNPTPRQASTMCQPSENAICCRAATRSAAWRRVREQLLAPEPPYQSAVEAEFRRHRHPSRGVSGRSTRTNSMGGRRWSCAADLAGVQAVDQLAGGGQLRLAARRQPPAARPFRTLANGRRGREGRIGAPPSATSSDDRTADW